MHASHNNESDAAAIERARQQLQAALNEVTGEAMRRALSAMLRMLEEASGATAEDPSTPAASIDYTFDDESYEPYGRQVEVRVFYRWEDYNQQDETPATWGAAIERVQVLAVRYFDEDGEEISPRDHHQDLAWDLLEQEREQVTEACTEDGYRRGLGIAPPSYVPLTGKSDAATASAEFAVRMAPSEPTRQAQPSQRRWG